MGGNLATIHNDEEEQFLKVFAEGERVWIGLTDAQQVSGELNLSEIKSESLINIFVICFFRMTTGSG